MSLYRAVAAWGDGDATLPCHGEAGGIDVQSRLHLLLLLEQGDAPCRTWAWESVRRGISRVSNIAFGPCVDTTRSRHERLFHLVRSAFAASITGSFRWVMQ
jgi:hypothetical protein